MKVFRRKRKRPNVWDLPGGLRRTTKNLNIVPEAKF